MRTPKQIADRLRGVVAEHIEPMCYVRRLPLRAEVWQCPDSCSVEVARGAEYAAVPLGWRWGPVWSTAWFRLCLPGNLHDVCAGSRKTGAAELSLRFSCGTEATVWSASDAAGVSSPLHGLDLNHAVVASHVMRRAWSRSSGGEYELYIEAACNRPLGATTFFWDDAAEVSRWKETLPGRLDFAELVELDAAYLRIAGEARFLAGLAEQVGDNGRCLMQLDLLSDAIEARLHREQIQYCIADVYSAAGGVVPVGRRAVCCAIGHAHIDTAWLWTVRETRRKCLRTFATALGLIESNPGFHFLCTQPRQYAWVEEDAPALFEEVRRRVREGRWEIGSGNHSPGASGAMWIEPDCNIPSGESLIRQFVHGSRYMQERFGSTSSHPYVFLPDTFGFPGSFPQILIGCGVRTFIFNKLWWNDSNPPTMSVFRWKGIDGTEVLSYLTPGMEYNATMTPAELIKGDTNHREKDATAPSEWLQPFGFGNGGGGPTQEMIDAARHVADLPMLPEVRFSRVDEFCERLHERVASTRHDGTGLPVWPERELYLERHRGTYTTQAWIKRANLEAEETLRIAEIITSASPAQQEDAEASKAKAAITSAWETVLLNQFHDILPGSSVKVVYDEARQQYKAVYDDITHIITTESLRQYCHASKNDTHGTSVIMNPASQTRSGVVALDGRYWFVADMPAISVRCVSESDRPGAMPASVIIEPLCSSDSTQGYRLSNGVIEFHIRHDGTIDGLRLMSEPPAASRPPINILSMYNDSPKYWEAWDIERDYIENPVPIAEPSEVNITTRDSLRAAISVIRSLGDESRVTQVFSLDAGSPRVDVRTVVEWRESRKLLRVLFPTRISAEYATYGIQFGHIERCTARGNSVGGARFEVCAHRWMDLSGILQGDNGTVPAPSASRRAGLAVLNAGIYGHSCADGVMGLTLLRSPKFPDETADMGRHEMQYSLMPHGGDWRSANVDGEAESLCRPLRVLLRSAQHSDTISDDRAASDLSGRDWAPFWLDASKCGGHVEVAAVKAAEDADGIIVRLVESRGAGGVLRIQWRIPCNEVSTVSLLEQPVLHDGEWSHQSDTETTLVSIRPFQIVTLRVK